MKAYGGKRTLLLAVGEAKCRRLGTSPGEVSNLTSTVFSRFCGVAREKFFAFNKEFAKIDNSDEYESTLLLLLADSMLYIVAYVHPQDYQDQQGQILR